MTATPFYDDGTVALYHGDARELDVWTSGDVMVTDPPYGRGWRQGDLGGDAHAGIAGDRDTSTRDTILDAWGDRPALMFGDLMLAPPVGTRQVLVYRKPPSSGLRGAIAGFRRDAEAVYVIGSAWPAGLGGRSSIIETRVAQLGGANGPAARFRHPHAKPNDVMTWLVDLCPPGVIVDPFAGSGSTLRAAADLGRRAIGVEIDERHCATAARRLAQGVLPLWATA